MAIQLVNGYVLVPEPADWTQGPEILLQWLTEIALAKRGYEDRASLRPLPQAQMSCLVVTNSATAGAQLEDQVRAALKSGQACVPCHPRPSYVAGVAGGGLVVTLEATQWPWAAGDCLFTAGTDGTIYTSQVQAVAGAVLTLQAPIPNVGTVWPLVFGRLEVQTAEQEGPDTLALNLRLYINAWRSPIASAAPVVFYGAPVVPAVVIADWGDQVNRTFSYDQAVDQIGFGAETLEFEQSYVQHGMDLSTVLRTDSAISDLEAFFCVIGGRRGNFWLPAQERAMLITGSVSATNFLVAPQGLENTWGDQPDLFLYFTKPGHTAQIGHISSVVAGPGGSEEVILDAGLGTPVDATWDVYRLRLMRLSDDKLQESYDADGYATVRVVAVELPLEYFSAPPVVPQPAYLYAFKARLDGSITWYQTSHSEAITYSGNTYTPTAISHGDLKRAMDGSDEKITITSFYGPNNPLASYLPFPPSDRLQLKIFRLDLGAPDPSASAVVLFQGFVSSVTMTGRKLQADVQSPIDFMDRKLPGFIIGTPCNAQLYGPGCGLNKDDWAFQTTFASLAGTTVYLTGDPGKPTNWFGAGHLITGAGLTREIRSIMASGDASARYLILNYPLYYAVAGQAVTCYPGCSHTPAADGCAKFNNFVNYQGHPLVPIQNPTLTAVETNDSSGKK